jgi:hypothetical protein
MNNIDIIVSRFNEDLKWTLESPFNKFQYIVYNKGNNDNYEQKYVKKHIKIENVGKCDHTYLFHIVSNYDNLANIIVFFPGSLDMIYKKNKAILILNKITQHNYENAYFVGYYHQSIKESFNTFKLDNYKTLNKNNLLLNNEKKLKKSRIRPYGNWYNYFFGNIQAHWVTFWGIFSIDKKDIIQHPIERYQLLLNTVNNHSNPETGHYIERSWGVIFYPLIHTNKVCINSKTV